MRKLPFVFAMIGTTLGIGSSRCSRPSEEQEAKEAKEAKEEQEAKEAKEEQEAKEAKEEREAKEAKEEQEEKEREASDCTRLDDGLQRVMGYGAQRLAGWFTSEGQSLMAFCADRGEEEMSLKGELLRHSKMLAMVNLTSRAKELGFAKLAARLDRLAIVEMTKEARLVIRRTVGVAYLVHYNREFWDARRAGKTTFEGFSKAGLDPRHKWTDVTFSSEGLGRGLRLECAPFVVQRMLPERIARDQSNFCLQ